VGKVTAAFGSLFFLFLAPGIVAGWVPFALSGWRVRPPILGLGAGRYLGGVLLAIGVACLVESFARFAIEGLGTPAPVAPTETLVVSGLYRYVRNPMYLAVLAVVVGQGLLLGNRAVLTYAGVLWAFFHLFVLGYEEPSLARRFGAGYAAYRAGVRRWWPRATPWTGTGPAAGC
jgi:protein-S-isoprenylcysteine O-methyltransferase Ste14